MIAEAEPFEGKYEILAKIREGGMGAIYKVRHRLLDEIRVIKVIRPHLSTSPEMGERFLREARLAIRVRHPNIAQLHDFSVGPDGTAYIVMEFIDGLTLADVLAGAAPIPLGLALEIARGALDAIGYLHRRDMVHRDVSPDNLMLGKDEEGRQRVTLLDLGIAKSLVGSSVLTSTGAFLGKPRYASPEHFGANGLDGVGPRSDLYSFGVVLYELLTGVCPVQGRDTPSWIAGHLFRPPLDFAESDPEGRIPAELRAILLKALAKSPEDRFASAQELNGALEPLRFRCPVEPGALDRALGALHLTALPAATPPSPGTTQEALDRRFAPLETPLPQPADRSSTLVLSPREAIPAPEAHRSQPPAERTQILPFSSTPGKTVAAAPSSPVPPEKEPESTAPSPVRRLIPALAAFVLLVLSLAVWWMVRFRETTPATGQAAERSTPRPVSGAPAPSVPEQRAQPEATTPFSESLPDLVPSAVPEPSEPQVVRPAAEERRAAGPPKVKVPREKEEPSSAPPQRERPAPATGSAEGAGRRPRNAQIEVRQVDPSSPATELPSTAEPETPMSQEPTTPPAPVGAQEPAPQGPPLQPARVVRTPKPVYPQQARGSGIHAVIILAVLVDAKGEPTRVEVRRSMAKRGKNGKPPTPAQALAFQNAAFAAAFKTRFEPAMRDGKPVEWLVELVEDFQPE